MKHALHSISIARVLDVLDKLSLNGEFLQNFGAAVLLTALVYLTYRMKWFPKGWAAGVVRNRKACIVGFTLAAMILPIALRLALLPWLAAPRPHIEDEFSHLLVADTLVSGRLANPPHPLWRHLDTLYVLQKPTYSSIYPIGQGLMLAFGEILTGNPWAGVLLVSALMAAAFCWMFFEWLPLPWAIVGGMLAAFGYEFRWMDSFWGGEFCALGGALLFGALVRLWKQPSPWMAFVAGLGWAIVWLIRPFESILLFLLLCVTLAVGVFRAGRLWTRWLIPVAMILIAPAGAGILTLLHNRAVTGSYTELPYTLSQQRDGVPQTFLWQRPTPEPPARFAELRQMYLWQLQEKQRSTLSRASSVLHTIWDFFVTPWYTVPIVIALFLWRDRGIGGAWTLLLTAAAAALLYPFFFPHYMAAICCLFAFVIVRGFMVLWRWSPGGSQAGRWITVLLLLGGLLKQPMAVFPFDSISGVAAKRVPLQSRGAIEEKLEEMGGKHVVFVRYGPHHSVHDEWVNNAANVDRSQVVWCRWMGLSEDEEVMRYYKDRRFWVVDVDGKKVATEISRYQAGGEYQSANGEYPSSVLRNK